MPISLMRGNPNSCFDPPDEAVEHLEVTANAVVFFRHQSSDRQRSTMGTLWISTYLEGWLVGRNGSKVVVPVRHARSGVVRLFTGKQEVTDGAGVP